MKQSEKLLSTALELPCEGYTLSTSLPLCRLLYLTEDARKVVLLEQLILKSLQECEHKAVEKEPAVTEKLRVNMFHL